MHAQDIEIKEADANKSELKNLPPQARLFKTDGDPVYCKPYGSGHINTTYLILDHTPRLYILQKINKSVFKNPKSLMENIKAVTTYLANQTDEKRKALTLVPTKSRVSEPTNKQNHWLVDQDGEYWRMYDFISDSIVLQQAQSPNDFKESGVAFGHFQRQLANFPAGTLHETIPRFHDTPNRYELFANVLKADTHGRAKLAAAEIEFALQRQSYADTLMSLHRAGDLPLRVTHNDTKLNNVLFDRDTRKPICVVDLDTVMPGFSVNDFGDSIRYGASTASEDEADLTKVNFSLPLLKAYTTGFLHACGESLTPCELAHLRDGAKMMTLECGLRFLTDFLDGDNYFAAKHDNQNLDRCRTQFKLVAEMESNWDAMQRVIDAAL